MKIRHDFVSNSSSSSFVVWGVKLDANKLIDAVREFVTPEKFAEIAPRLSKYADITTYEELEDACDEKSLYGISEFLEKAFADAGTKSEVTYQYDGDRGEIYAGISPDNMKESETLAQFKERVSKSIASGIMNIEAKDVKFMKGVVYDGEGIEFD